MKSTVIKYQDKLQNEVLLATSDTLFPTLFLQKKRQVESSGFLPTHNVSPYNQPFTFTGKEWCKSQWIAQRGPERGISETGFSYFGARYYDSDLSGLFLSIDPMSDKYPSISPYAYCVWNPLKLVDPDGKKVEYSSIKDRIIVFIAKTFNKNFKIRLDDLKSSEETYMFKCYKKENGKGGEVTTDGEKIIINYNTWSNESQGSNAFVNLEHETEHAIQFEYGEVGFDKTRSNTKSWNGSVVNMDLYDEVAARDIGYEGWNFTPNADNVRNSWMGSTEDKANHLSKQAAYEKLPKERMNNQNKEKVKDDNKYMLPHRTRPSKYK